MSRSRVAWVALPAALALTLSACGGGGGGTTSSGNENPDGTVSIYGTEPENQLLPAATTEAGGSKIVDALYSRLVGYKAEDGSTYNLMAESITTSDAKVYDIKIKSGWTFHDGTPVKAKNFVDAWNYGAYAKNAQQAGTFFAPIAGYSDVHPDDEKAEPTKDKMSGLEVVSDTEFKVTLSAPNSVFKTMIGYTPFSPLPDSFFADPKAFEAKPIGNGPMKFVSRTPNALIKLERFDDYKGEDKVHFKTLDVKIYSSQETAYQDLVAGKLDFMEALPPSAKVGEKYKADLGDQVLNANLLGQSAIAFPLYVPAFQNVKLRQAVSMALNREQITKTVLAGSYVPADGFVPPGIEGYEKGVCGEFCTYNPEKAKQLLQESGFTGKLTIQSNQDGGRKEPLEAACNSIKQALGIECEFVGATNFGAYRQIVNGKQLTGMGRSDWSADYPSIENFLNPLYRTGGSSNDSNYSNAEVDKILKEADATADSAAAIKKYQEAHKLIAKDLPSIPTWNEKGIGARSKNLLAAKLTFTRDAELAAFRVKG
ncbi:peptide ABC transporter substrate-binding protein [Lentzea albida]|uniref:Oligopeptide transport system substrate-binding protein n=1 Tax=Lentzea albida TaxID=65499 RepID=A0A1H9C243_9PSEU|nr:ABC transporter substrate-binding protein [Lentzea albida]SEP95259.1 oligopeptide transport system substrate-binding protein [Lentzea albida]